MPLLRGEQLTQQLSLRIDLRADQLQSFPRLCAEAQQRTVASMAVACVGQAQRLAVFQLSPLLAAREALVIRYDVVALVVSESPLKFASDAARCLANEEAIDLDLKLCVLVKLALARLVAIRIAVAAFLHADHRRPVDDAALA